MLVQLPGGSSDLPDARDAHHCSSFEAGLRRDLASAPVVSYDAMLGGAAKRAIDLAITMLALPVWLPIFAGGVAWLKLSQGGQVVTAQERIGYGGRPFKCLSLRMQAPPEAERSPEGGCESAALSAGVKWRSAFERLPQMLNIITGDMALVGPRPLSRDQLEPLRSARSYYLSARPGVVGVGGVIAEGQEAASQYKTYALAWEVTTDALILWDALLSLLERGEPGRPASKSEHPSPAAERPREGAEPDQDTL